MRTADKAILAGATALIGYELVVDYDELISVAVARYKQTRPMLTTAVVIVTAAHLLEWLPSWADPFHGFGVFLQRKAPHGAR